MSCAAPTRIECPDNPITVSRLSPPRLATTLIRLRTDEVSSAKFETLRVCSPRKRGPDRKFAASIQASTCAAVAGERYAIRPSPNGSDLERGTSIELRSTARCSMRMATSSELRQSVSYPTRNIAASRKPASVGGHASTILSSISVDTQSHRHLALADLRLPLEESEEVNVEVLPAATGFRRNDCCGYP